ncbi:MAG: penicillin-binding protein 2 [Dehalococcoidia bacterium]
MARRTNRSWRLFLLITMLAVASGAVVLRLVQVQVLDHDHYKAQAADEHLEEVVVRAPRGAILDRNGYPLATSVEAFDVYIDPRSWKDDVTALRSASVVAPLLGRDAGELITSTRAQTEGVYAAARSVPAAVGLKLLDEEPSGVSVVDTSKRFYPEGDLASVLLGFLGRDQTGLAGIESDFDLELGGQPGLLYFERDAVGNPLPFGRRVADKPVPGGDVQLTIDRYIQRLVEEKLDAEIQRHEASGGTILVMDPFTGEVLALASRPSFQLSKLNFDDPGQADLFRNRAVTDVYSPGSVMKTITMSMAIDLGLVSPGTTYFDSGEALVEGGESIKNWDFSAHGTTTMTQVLQYSLNTGAVWVSRQVGADRFYDYMARFGFGTKTDIGLGGEPDGLIRTNQEDSWYPVDLATNSFGQGISVTPLQMVTAVSSLVNGGLLMRPYVVKELNGPDGQRVFDPVAVRRTVSEETSQTLVQMMNAVVDGMPDHPAQVAGYHIGGKSGTTTFEDRPYSIASFIGFAPVEQPRFVMLVKIDEPKDDPLGGRVSAPIFGALAPQILSYLGARPDDAALVEGN